MGVKGLNENNINCKMLSDQLRGRVRLFTLWVSKLAAKKKLRVKKESRKSSSDCVIISLCVSFSVYNLNAGTRMKFGATTRSKTDWNLRASKVVQIS